MKVGSGIALSALAVLLASCATPEQRAARISGECSSYGYSPGTDAFANCVQQKYADLESRREAASLMAIESLRTMSQKPQVQLPPQSTCVWTRQVDGSLKSVCQ